MIFFDQKMQEGYQIEDKILAKLHTVVQPGDDEFTSQQWLLESLPKRLIFQHMYGDLVEQSLTRKRVLDVGGGFTSLTRIMLENHDYRLLDIVAHDNHDRIRKLEKKIGKSFWINDDWYNWEPDDEYEVVIANDLFPNVDQRLSIFLKKFLSLAHEIRLSLTYYNQQRWYRVRRTDADEILHMMAFNGTQTALALSPFNDYIQKPDLKELSRQSSSLFPNGRQVCMVILKQGGKVG